MAVVKCCKNLDVSAKICMFASDTSSTNNAPYCGWRGLFDNNKKWKIKLNIEHAKPGSSATQHNYYFANVGTLKKCLVVSAIFWHPRADIASMPSLGGGQNPTCTSFLSVCVHPVDGWERLGVG